ncbi:MAG: response regulator [Chloroflexia bacterium]
MDIMTKVLVVDDDPAILDICADLLESEGYDVALAANGQQAINQMGTNAPDVVLMDIMMPVLNGVEACRRMKADPETARIPVVLMSARTNLNRQNQELDSADALLAKPFDINHLLDTIQELLSEHSTK